MIGADIVDIRRIAEAIKSQRFVDRVFTDNEQKYAQSKANFAQTYAGIFAAKEAVAKLSGRGIRGYALTDIEITHTDLGAPEVKLHGKAKELFSSKVFVSISHEREYAFAVATYTLSTYAPIFTGREINDGDLGFLGRNRFTHKGDYGRVYVIGGSSLMVGAPLITAQASVKAGAGLTTLCSASSLLYSYRQRVTEIMLKDVKDEDGYMILDKPALSDVMSKADVIAIGMGMGNNPNLPEILGFLFAEFGGTLVCDADAINALAKNPTILLSSRKCNLILTPHVGEFERLSKSLQIDAVEDCAQKIGCVIACKSAHTVITDGITTYKTVSGTAAMAKGGSGDALAGIISAYSCRTTPLDATTLACHHFGRCGEKAEAALGENAVTATDIISYL